MRFTTTNQTWRQKFQANSSIWGFAVPMVLWGDDAADYYAVFCAWLICKKQENSWGQNSWGQYRCISCISQSIPAVHRLNQLFHLFRLRSRLNLRLKPL